MPELPYQIPDAVAGLNGNDLASWFVSNTHEVESLIATHGAVLFRGTDVRTVEDFELVCRSHTPDLVSYVGGGSPRTRLGGAVYTSTEYAPKAHIRLHCEAVYFPDMPRRVWFFCHTPPTVQGETPVGDMRRVEARLSPDLVERFQRLGVLYVSNFHGGHGFGKSWMDAYETDERELVEDRLREKHAEFEWRADGGLRVQYRTPATRVHSVSGQRIWVSQAANWHPLCFGHDHFNRMMQIYGSEMNFPTFSFYGDGSPIDQSDICQMTQALEAEEELFTWRKGDILLIDNELIAHGRRPFEGKRVVYVALS